MKKKLITYLLALSCIVGGSICSGCGGGTNSAFSEDDYVFFGNYPQTKVEDEALLDLLNDGAGALPTAENSLGWTIYDYYKEGSKDTPYMWYVDKEEGGQKYRGVYFTEYRPFWSDYAASAINSYQDDNGYKIGNDKTENVYWFKYEPIQWRILSESSGKALILCENLIDSQAFHHTMKNKLYGTKEKYDNNYENSAIRAWLNDAFYNTAFNEEDKESISKTSVDNKTQTTSSTNNPYICSDTEDNVFLLSYQDMINADYKFNTGALNNDPIRKKKTTDYAQCQGAYTNGAGYDYWWLRSPASTYECNAVTVGLEGNVFEGRGVLYASGGVCPAMYVDAKIVR